MGAKKKPFYRVVVADSKKAPTGKFIEILGHYDPNTDPETVELDIERVDEWISKGAQMSDTVKSLVKKARVDSQKA